MGPVAAIAAVVGQMFSGWIESRKVKQEKELEIKRIEALGEVERAKSLAEAEASYDNLAQQQMSTSWKDEYLVLVISAPFVISFLAPFINLFFEVDMSPSIAEAWRIVGTAPEWYQFMFGGIIVATFGLRWAVNQYKGKAMLGKDNAK